MVDIGKASEKKRKNREKMVREQDYRKSRIDRPRVWLCNEFKLFESLNSLVSISYDTIWTFKMISYSVLQSAYLPVLGSCNKASSSIWLDSDFSPEPDFDLESGSL